MSVYKFFSNLDGFMSFSISAEELIAKMGGRFNPRFNAKPCAQDWQKPSCYFFSEAGYTKIPDITCWAIGCLVLNQKAYDTIGVALASYGEFLPAECEQIPYYVFNALNVVNDEAVNQSTSKQDIELGVFMGVKSLAFHEIQLKESLVFKTNFDKKVSLFCTDVFKKLVENNKLQGLTFCQDLVA